MYARITTFHGKSQEIDNGVVSFERDVVPALRGLKGYDGALLLGDRSTGKAYTVTLWDSLQHRQASEDAANRLRQEAGATLGAPTPAVERFDVLVADLTPSAAAMQEIARRICEEIYSEGKVELFDEVCGPGYVYHDPVAGDLDVEAEKKFVRMLRAAFPDLRLTIEHGFSPGDSVCIQWHATGTHRGPFMGVPGSGRTIDLHGIDVMRFSAGKVIEVSTQINSLGLMQQLGIVPELPGQAPVAGEEIRPS